MSHTLNTGRRGFLKAAGYVAVSFSIPAAEAVAQAPPDGSTLLLPPHALAIMPRLPRSLGFDPVRDLAPLTLLASTDLVLVASSRLQAA